MFKKLQEQNITTDIMSVTTSIGRVLNDNNATLSLKNNVYVVSPKTSQAFESKFKAFYNQEPRTYSDRAYDTLMLLVDAIQNKGTMPLADYLRTKTDYNGYAGEYKFDSTGDIVGGDWIIQKLK
jgi:ABC-type branched-subunit amino acid transport system substrate-binding protein